MTLTLQRIALDDHVAINFYFNFIAESWGRWSGDYTPYSYFLDIRSGGAPLRRYALGAATIPRSGNGFGPLQGPLPLTPADFPEPFFAPIDNVMIFGDGNQESR